MGKTYDVIVVGGGASGMMAAISAKRAGKSVLVLEKNKSFGEKLKITGGGRCNIFNAEFELEKLLKQYGRAEPFLRGALREFGANESKSFFGELGIYTKVEDRKRAFPVTEKALDVFNSMHAEMTRLGVEMRVNSSVENVEFRKQDNGDILLTGVKIKGEDKLIAGRKYIISCGGYSHPETGSTGDGFKFLSEVGVKINNPNPSLVPVSTENDWVKKLSGKVVENVKLSFFVDGLKKKVLRPSDKANLETKNRVLFTHFGLSGPTILNNSKFIGEWLQEGEVNIVLDLFPQMDEKQLNDLVLNVFSENLNKTLKNILNEIYTGNILQEIFEANLPDLDLGKKVNDVRVEERKKIIQVLKNLKVNISGLMGFDKAIIASGGVDLNEVDFKDMSLKKVKNLHVTGDMLDIERPSGGFSLQLCWTTGFLAGK